MAYVSYSPRDFHGVRNVVSAPIVVRSAFVAVAAAVAILALSEVSGSGAAVTAAAKADRVSSAGMTVLSEAPAGYSIDVAARTTTVERGAVVPLSPESPMAAQAN